MLKKPRPKAAWKTEETKQILKGEVSVAITRKYSVKPYETVDVFVSVTAATEPEETQEQATARVYKQLKVDAEKMCSEIKEKCKDGEL